MPFMNIGSISRVIKYKYPKGVKDECLIATVMKSCLEALIYLNENNCLHRDIKPENILLSSDGTICLCDMGVATFLKPGCKKNSMRGSFAWNAPEIFLSEDYDWKVINKLKLYYLR